MKKHKNIFFNLNRGGGGGGMGYMYRTCRDCFALPVTDIIKSHSFMI